MYSYLDRNWFSKLGSLHNSSLKKNLYLNLWKALSGNRAPIFIHCRTFTVIIIHVPDKLYKNNTVEFGGFFRDEISYYILFITSYFLSDVFTKNLILGKSKNNLNRSYCSLEKMLHTFVLSIKKIQMDASRKQARFLLR